MSSSDDPRQLQIMIAFAGKDRESAIALRDTLVRRGIDAFIDEATPSGDDIMRTINDAIDQRDYFVLLWSVHGVGNSYLEAEIYAARMRGLTEQRPFLHIVRLDDTSPPRLLAMIRYLDADGDLEAIADQLVATWDQDRSLARPTTPVETIDIYVHNDDLSVARQITVPAQATVQDLMVAVRLRLRLQAQVTGFDGQVGARFFYRLEKDAQQLAEEQPLATAGLTDSSRVYLGVRVEWFGPRQLAGDATFMNGKSAGLSNTITRQLLHQAFGHLSSRYTENGHQRYGSQPSP